MDAPRAAPEPVAQVPSDSIDAYSAFWQCMDADDSPPIVATPNRNVRGAYEQFWDLLDAD